MYIQISETPNPNALQFFPGAEVSPVPLSYRGPESAPPLVKELFSIDGVEEILLGKDFISVIKNQNKHWHNLKTFIVAKIINYLQGGGSIVPPEWYQKDGDNFDELENEIVKQIVELIETKVKPAVAADGGHISFERFDHESGIVYLKMSGACSGCPSSAVTLKGGVENLLKHYVPEVTSVEQIFD